MAHPRAAGFGEGGGFGGFDGGDNRTGGGYARFDDDRFGYDRVGGAYRDNYWHASVYHRALYAGARGVARRAAVGLAATRAHER